MRVHRSIQSWEKCGPQDDDMLFSSSVITHQTILSFSETVPSLQHLGLTVYIPNNAGTAGVEAQ